MGYIQGADNHYVENTASEPLAYMELLQSPRYIDLSAAQRLGLTPAEVVRETVGVEGWGVHQGAAEDEEIYCAWQVELDGHRSRQDRVSWC